MQNDNTSMEHHTVKYVSKERDLPYLNLAAQSKS